MTLEILGLGILSGLRPGTALAAVLVLLKSPTPQRPLLVFTAAGFAWSWTIGLVVVAVFHGADVAIGGSTFTSVVEVALGAAALGFAAGLRWGWVQPGHREGSTSAAGPSSRLTRRLRDPSARVAAAAGVGTHLPGLIYLVALNVIASGQPTFAEAGLQVAIYDALWLTIPLGSLVLVVMRPGAALVYLEAATAWARRNERAVLLGGALAIGVYLCVKGTASLISSG